MSLKKYAQLQNALSRCDNQGGAGIDGPQKSTSLRLAADFQNDRLPVQSIFVISSYFVLAFTWSWFLSFIASYTTTVAPSFSFALTIVSGFGPSVAALITITIFFGRSALMVWLTNALNWCVGWRWYALAFFAPPLILLVALALHEVLGGTVPTSPAVGHVPLAIAKFALVFLIGGPLGEEFGWRGYALPALGVKLGWRAASLAIGVIWGRWHLPLFFTPGTAQFQMSINVFMLNIVAGSVVFSWLFIRTSGSVLPALVLHTSLNSWVGILSIVPSAETSRPYAFVTGILAALACWPLLHAHANSRESF